MLPLRRVRDRLSNDRTAKSIARAHSYRKASIGSRRAALIAGNMPLIMPTKLRIAVDHISPGDSEHGKERAQLVRPQGRERLPHNVEEHAHGLVREILPPRLRGGAWGPRVTFRRGVSIPPNI